jgi:hypothetical protein
MTCTTQKNNGRNVDCTSFLKEAVAIVIGDAGTLSFDNSYALDNAENWRVKIQEEESVSIFPINGAEVTPGEAQTETTPNGRTFVSGENTGSVIAYLDTNACDYKEVLKYFKGGTYDIMWLDADANALGYDTGTNLDGYKAQLHAPNYGGVGSRENQSQMFKMHVNYINNAEQNSPFVQNLGISLNTLEMYIPVGMTLVESTAYVPGTGVVVMDIFKRCTNTKYTNTILSGLVGEVVEVRGQADASGVTVTPVWNGATLKWDITIADGAGQLAAGVSCEFRLAQKTGSVYDYVSNTKPVTGA